MSKNKYKVLITVDFERCREALSVFDGIADVDLLPPDAAKVLPVIDQYDAYMSGLDLRVSADFVAKAKRLKVLGSPSTGTDHLDLKALRAAGVTCFDISKEFDLINSFTATSEMAFTLLLSVNRKMIPAAAAVLKGDWGREAYTGFQLSGKTMGILGLGRLGTISSRIARGFGMRVIATDVRDVRVEGVEMVPFDQLLVESDVLSIHVHLNDQTRGMIDRRALGLMKRTAILINTSRGALIDEKALQEALSSGLLAGAGLDLIDGEWMDDVTTHPLVEYARNNANLVISPHIGGATHESIVGARIFMAKKIADQLAQLG